MSTTLYVFSATGNSLTSARMLASQLEDCRVVSVASLKHSTKVVDNADAIGFVFPVYHGSMPWPVRELINKMVFSPEAYIFILPTFRGSAGKTAQRADQLLRTRGQKLALSLGLLMPGNSSQNEPQVDAAYLAAQQENVAAMVGRILARETEDYTAAELIPASPVDHANNFRGIMSDENCIGCGTCVRVCPMENIRIENGKSVIGDACATCLACFHWCPKEAIYMSKQENMARRVKYHHPDITLRDILAQKE